MNDEDAEALRVKFRPHRVRVVFVGESRPAGDTFFYCANSRLFERTREAFDRSADDGPTFLRHFMARGCYLVDLCPTPVNRLRGAKRRACHASGEAQLAAQLRALTPAAVIVVIKSIKGSVERAAAQAGLSAPMFVLPFPSQGHDREYVDGLRAALRQLPD